MTKFENNQRVTDPFPHLQKHPYDCISANFFFFAYPYTPGMRFGRDCLYFCLWEVMAHLYTSRCTAHRRLPSGSLGRREEAIHHLVYGRHHPDSAYATDRDPWTDKLFCRHQDSNCCHMECESDALSLGHQRQFGLFPLSVLDCPLSVLDCLLSIKWQEKKKNVEVLKLASLPSIYTQTRTPRGSSSSPDAGKIICRFRDLDLDA